MKKSLVYAAVLSVCLLSSVVAYADDYVLTIKNHQFSPQVLTVPAGQKVKIIVRNQDATPAEFESSDLNREKVVAANSEITIFIGPLNAGSYGFFDDFHRDTTTGTIVVK